MGVSCVGVEEVDKMKHCEHCDDWDENVETIDNLCILVHVSGGEQIHFKPFSFCPWCGRELADNPIPEEKK